MKIVIDLELSPRQKQIIRGAVVAGAVIAALGIGVALADPLAFSTNESLSSTKMNGNFNDLNTRLHALEAMLATETADGGYSLGATFCGTTAATEGAFSGPGPLTGYASAKAQCQGATGCSAAAHMCTTEELARTRQLGAIVSVSGWYASMNYGSNVNASTVTSDCGGWTSNGTTVGGSSWAGPMAEPYDDICVHANAILCCN